jgi:hypothetical protein
MEILDSTSRERPLPVEAGANDLGCEGVVSRIFTGWGEYGIAYCLVEGEGPPRFANGKPFPDVPDLILTIEAQSWEEAKEEYEKRLEDNIEYRYLEDNLSR